MRWKACSLVLLALAAPAAAQSMNAEAFYQRATALQKKGLMALFSGSEIKTLTKEGQAAGAKAREQRLSSIKAGQKPRYCPPDGPVSMGDKEFVSRLAAIPQAERQHIDMTEAMIRILAAKYPCKR